MIKKILLIGLICFSVVGLHAQTPEAMFQAANQLYQDGKYSDAKDAYESILQKDLGSPELYFNLGNVYYKLGDIGMTILFYERAARFIPNDEDLRHNLEMANLLIADKIEPTPRLFVWDYWDFMKDAFSLHTLTWLTYGIFLLVIGSAIAFVLTRSYDGRKMFFLFGSLSLAVLILFLIITVGKYSALERKDFAVVTANITTLKNSPDQQSSDAFVLHSGVKVQITDRVNKWVKIRLADGKVAWMESSAAEVI